MTSRGDRPESAGHAAPDGVDPLEGRPAEPPREGTYCPSAQPDMDGSLVLGVVGGTVSEPRVGFLTEPVTFPGDVERATAPVRPTEVFRFAAPCAESGCRHYGDGSCQLARRVVDDLPVVVDRLPACRLRPTCRWWKQEGKAACLRCPVVVTERPDTSSLRRRVAGVSD